MRTCDGFFNTMRSLGLALTYDEVRLKTAYSEVLPNTVSLETRFSRNVPLKIPVVSAAMDTVTESRMAIAMAKLGGLGIIHRSLGAKEQKEEVRRVKFHLSGLIAKPVVVTEKETIKEIEAQRTERGFSFHSFPVVNNEEDRMLLGLITENDFDFCDDHARTAREVMTPRKDLVAADPKTTIEEAYTIMRKAKKKVLPLVDKDGRLAGMYLLSDLNRIGSAGSAMHNVDHAGRLRVGAAIGVGDDALERVEMMREYADVFVVDSAHGDSKNVIETIKKLKSLYGDKIDVVAGNISEGESARRLIDAGADGVKVGQGPGSICTTRVVAGIGCPQVTAIYNVAKVAEDMKREDVPVCADGGIVNPGDLTIGIGAGAHTVMLGRILAGTDEAPGSVETFNNATVKFYRGMGSRSAMESYRSSRERYAQTNVQKEKIVPEGVEGFVPYAGSLESVMNRYVGGLRLGMGYVGAASIAELRERADFYRITPAGLRESHPHDIEVLPEGGVRGRGR